MTDRIDQRLTYRKLWVFKLFFAFESLHHRADGHLAPDDVPRCFDQTWERAGQFFATGVTRESAFATRSLADKLGKHHARLG